MKNYVLFTEKELDDLMRGKEIIHTLSNGSTVYFACKEHFLTNDTDVVEPVIFETRDYAEGAIDHLVDIADTYGCATVADWYDICGLESSYQMTKIGWMKYVLVNVKPLRTRTGYMVELPRPSHLV